MEFDALHVESLACSSSRLAVMLRNPPEVRWSSSLQRPTYSLLLLDYLNP
jgi:hypothetical protein